jgi:hypothetical protein
MSNIIFKTTKRESKEYLYESHIWNLSNQLKISDILKLKEFSKFKYAGKISKADNSAGYKIEINEDFKDKKFVLYLLVIDGYVLKGGKSKNSLDTRSYPAGTEESWTMRGTPSVTNYIWSQIFRSRIENGFDDVEFYAYVVPSFRYEYESFDGEKIVEDVCGHYETEEKKLNHLLKDLNGGNSLIGEGSLDVKNKS